MPIFYISTLALLSNITCLFITDPNTCPSIVVRDYGNTDKSSIGTFSFIGKGKFKSNVYYNPNPWIKSDWKMGVHGDFLYHTFGKWIIAVILLKIHIHDVLLNTTLLQI